MIWKSDWKLFPKKFLVYPPTLHSQCLWELYTDHRNLLRIYVLLLGLLRLDVWGDVPIHVASLQERNGFTKGKEEGQE